MPTLTAFAGAFRAIRRTVIGDDEPMAALRPRMRVAKHALDRTPLPRSGIASALAVAFMFGGWTLGAGQGQTSNPVLDGLAGLVGLQATDIRITGQIETSEADVVAALGLGPNGSLIGFDAGEARTRLMELPWIRNAAVRKLYPGKLAIAIAERRPAAVWQLNDRLTVVDGKGAKIARFGITDLLENRFAHLPHLVGENASLAAPDILPLVADHPILAGQVSSYVFVAERRWDLELTNGMRVKLPEVGVARSLERLAALASEERVLEREIATVDMRLGDRITFALEPAAAKTRAELVAARLKAMKKADRKL
ncbi:MAG: FtsQ-type POTRA domain-containing protein [Pseudomonadota bacterium]